MLGNLDDLDDFVQLVGNLDRLYFLRLVCPTNDGVQVLRIFVAQMFKAGAREQHCHLLATISLLTLSDERWDAILAFLPFPSRY